MSEMVRGLFLGSPVVVLPSIALVLFVATFVVATVRAIRAERLQVERVARLPLEGEGESREASHG